MDAPIAIIGLDARLPGEADTADRFFDFLLAGRSARAEVPPDRYQSSAFWHPDAERHGKTRTRHAHFLKGSISAFDAPFFNITPEEASAMDPQQRGILECTYNALENAGLPLEKVGGTETGVFVGCLNYDYDSLQKRDVDARSKYSALGNKSSILSNRVSWFYDFRGPSITIDTACSSSLVAVHEACMSLKLREASTAIAIGCNLIISPDTTLEFDALGVLSPDGTSYSFDHRANGYSRGEGFGAVVLKRLSDAIRDGDVVRAVIRNTSSNQDGRSPGISQPTKAAQAALIRKVYSAAAIDPSVTRFFEAHGTGTQIGDPIEASAISEIFTPHRSADSPLYIGAVKSNIGHLEGAAGIASVIKGVLTLETGLILPNANFEIQNPAIPDSWHLKFPTEAVTWPQPGLRRMSINSFGFGGTNAHLILDDAYHFMKQGNLDGLHRTTAFPGLAERPGNVQIVTARVKEETGLYTPPLPDDGTTSSHECGVLQIPQIFTWSSYDKDGVSRFHDRLMEWMLLKTMERPDAGFLKELSFTLAAKRSHHGWRSFIVADSHAVLQSGLSGPREPVRAKSNPGLAFVFTGQGAQWPSMGRELLVYPAFKQSLYAADKHLGELGCVWSLLYEMFKEGKASKMDEPEYGQPICTALQIALVDLLASWDVTPHAVVGHSSGEIAAAYAAGHLSREMAWKISFLRGRLCSEALRSNRQPKTSMAAVALDLDEAVTWVRRANASVGQGTLEVACMNSERSLTISGDDANIDALVKMLRREKVFARKLSVEIAYHSRFMLPISHEYGKLIGDIACAANTGEAASPAFFSSLAGTRVDPRTLREADYWVDNLVSPVRFYEAVTELLNPDMSGLDQPITEILEIGPHSALKGPLRNIVDQNDAIEPVEYLSMLRRGDSAVGTALEAAASLFCRGYNVDLLAVNKMSKSPDEQPLMLTNLPSYPFNHTKEYWAESRLSKNFRLGRVGRHELLGAPVADWNPANAIWRNWIRLSEHPWVADHKVSGEVLYPAAGMLVMAIEASRQVSDESKVIKGFRFKEVFLHHALRIPQDSTGIESHFYLRPLRDEGSSGWHEFQLFTLEGDEWHEHCHGMVQTEYEVSYSPVDGGLEEMLFTDMCRDEVEQTRASCTSRLVGRDVYRALRKIGLEYGSSFQTLREAWHGNLRVLASAESALPKVSGCMRHNYVQPNLLHPATLDGILQASLLPLVLGSKRSAESLLPTYAKDLWISVAPHGSYIVSARSDRVGGSHANLALTAIDDQTNEPMVHSSGFVVKSFQAKNAHSVQKDGKHLAFNLEWKPDPTFLSQSQASRVFDLDTDVQDRLTSDARECVVLCLLYLRRLVECYPACVPGLSEHYARYVAWARRVTEAHAPDLLNDVTELEERLRAKDLPEGKLIMAVGQALPDIVAGHVDPLEVVFKDKIAEDAYSYAFGAQGTYSRLSSYVDALVHKNPGMRFIEVGAGTGGATRPMLETLSRNGPRYSHYDFTDISPSFFENAKDTFKEHAGRMSFRVLNVEKNPIDQGFEAGGYDVVVAANVLHATKSLESTLRKVRQLLKPGGKLILYEHTNPTAVPVGFCFGVFSGWWLSEEPEREWSPLMTVQGWGDYLQASGFSRPEVVLSEHHDPEAVFTSVMVATAEGPGSKSQTLSRSHVLIQNNSALQQVVADRLSCAVSPDEVCQVTSLPWVQYEDLSESTCIVLAELDQSLLEEPSEESWAALKHVIRQCKRVCWVTRGGAGSAPSPHQELVTGLARVLRSEEPDRPFVVLSFEHGERVDVMVNTTLQVLRNDETAENTFRVMAGMVHVPRLVDAPRLNDHIETQTGSIGVSKCALGQHPSRPLALQVGTLAMLDTLRFEDDLAYQQPLGEKEVEFKAMACGLNFKDLTIVLGKTETEPLGLEASGIVTRVGSASSFKVGDEVFGLSLHAEGRLGGGIKTYVRSPEGFLAKKPAWMSWTEAASVLLVHTTAYGCLQETGTVRKGDTILIHAGAGGLGQAAIQLAQDQGAEVFATVSSTEKRDFLEAKYGIPRDHIFSSRDLTFKSHLLRITKSRGVDIILNSLSGEKLRASWDCVAPFGRFVELGLGDVNSNANIPMGNFSRYTRFESFDLSYLVQLDPRRAQRMFQETVDLLVKRLGGSRQATPVQVFPMSDAQAAFRLMQSGKHIGKIVLEPHDDDVVPVLPRASLAYSLSSEASYVISGGLGGLGRSISRWMFSRGARNFILISRRGPVRGSAKELVRELESKGARVATPACDVADAKLLQQTISQCLSSGMPPIRGCIQAAMVLKDNRLQDMTLPEWMAALRPKVNASWNLHKALGEDLDFFVLLSSNTGILGYKEQSNYAAGNTFQDALARHRVARGLHAVALDLPAMADSGFVAERPELLGSLRAAGVDVMSENQLNSVLDYYCDPSRGVPSTSQSQVTLGLALPQDLAASDIPPPLVHSDPLLSHLLQLKAEAVHKEVHREDVKNEVLLSTASSIRAAEKIVLDALLSKLSRILSVDVLNIEPGKPMHAYGVDSLVAVELRSWMSKELGAELSVLDMTNKSSINALAAMATARSRYVLALEKG